jgi:hypothetical protein
MLSQNTTLGADLLLSPGTNFVEHVKHERQGSDGGVHPLMWQSRAAVVAGSTPVTFTYADLAESVSATGFALEEMSVQHPSMSLYHRLRAV